MHKMNLTASVISPSLRVNTGLQPRRMGFEEGATRWKILRSGWNSASKRRRGKIAKKKMIALTAEIIPLVDDKDDRLVHRAANQEAIAATAVNSDFSSPKRYRRPALRIVSIIIHSDQRETRPNAITSVTNFEPSFPNLVAAPATIKIPQFGGIHESALGPT